MRKDRVRLKAKQSPNDEADQLVFNNDTKNKDKVKRHFSTTQYKERLINSQFILKCKNTIQHIRECNTVFSAVQSFDIYRLTMFKSAYIAYLVLIFLLIGINIWALVLNTNVFFSKQTYGNYFWIVEPMHISSIVLLLILTFFLSGLYIRQDYSISVKIGAAVSIFAIHICVVMLYILQSFNTNIVINTRARILKYLILTQVIITYTVIFVITVMYFILALVKK
ncbi:Hypothetical protein GLP15_1407 [Giardia lamblia P15]|uniref:Uncharacterized protein n=1 Tax=Giardia intestinalis (strain P15) TaxID=658858 RepID=E1F4W1_GIAIA|nr:Hypothetical protein GLP15_1407 [Giardia lamblia P15]